MDFLDEVEQMPENDDEIFTKKINNLLDNSIYNSIDKQYMFKMLLKLMLNNKKLFNVEE